MPEYKFVPKPYEQIQDRPEMHLIRSLYSARPGEIPNWRDVLDLPLSDVIGPLTVRERWDLLGNYSLESFRRSVNLEGSSRNVAFNIRDAAERVGYPANIMILKLVDHLSTPSPLDTNLRQAVNNLTVEIVES